MSGVCSGCDSISCLCDEIDLYRKSLAKAPDPGSAGVGEWSSEYARGYSDGQLRERDLMTAEMASLRLAWPPQSLSEAWQERRTLQAVLRMLDGDEE